MDAPLKEISVPLTTFPDIAPRELTILGEPSGKIMGGTLHLCGTNSISSPTMALMKQRREVNDMLRWMMEHKTATTIIVSVLTAIATNAILSAIGW